MKTQILSKKKRVEKFSKELFSIIASETQPW